MGALLFHRTLSTNIRSIISAGFSIVDVEEPILSRESVNEYSEFISI